MAILFTLTLQMLTEEDYQMPVIEPIDKSLKALSGIHLWHAPMSSCSQRVRIALAEKGLEFTGHLIDLNGGENATEEYQRIHPDGLVPAMVINGDLIIESIDIILEIDERFHFRSLTPMNGNSESAMRELLQRANTAQSSLKLLTFEFLFRAAPPPSEESFDDFQRTHKNEALKKFHRDFAEGFSRERVKDSVAKSDEDFSALDALFVDGRSYLGGDRFSLADIAWMPNFHRFELINWPFDRYPNLPAWFERVKERPSYRTGLVEWEPGKLLDIVRPTLNERVRNGDGIEQYLSSA